MMDHPAFSWKAQVLVASPLQAAIERHQEKFWGQSFKKQPAARPQALLLPSGRNLMHPVQALLYSLQPA